MKKILPYVFGLRALIVIVIMLAGIFGMNLRADAEPTEPPPTEPTSLPVLCAGLAEPEPAETCQVEVVLTDSQLEHVSDAAVGLAWGMGVLVFCGIVTAICIAKGNKK